MKQSYILGLSILSLLMPLQTFAFTDVNNSDPHEQAINSIYEQGIVKGYSDGTYKSKNLINRAEFTKIIMEWLYKDKIAGSNCFFDINKEWFSSYVCGAKALSLIQGYGDGEFKPSNHITLAEALKITIEAKKITVSDNGVANPWYQKYWSYALQNPNILKSIGQDPNHQITRGEMASLVYNVSNLNNSTPNPSSNNQQEEELKAIINNFSHDKSPLEKKQYLTENYGKILSNFMTMASYLPLKEDPYMAETMVAMDLGNDFRSNLNGVWNFPNLAIAKLDEVNMSDDSAQVIYKTVNNYGEYYTCISLKKENGWKIDRTGGQVCGKSYPEMKVLTSDELHYAGQNFKSEYVYDVYLNGYLVQTGTWSGGVNTRGLPLKNGLNEVKIITGESQKTDSVGDDQFSQLGDDITGLQYTLSADGKELIKVEVTEPNKTVTKTFNYSL